MSPKAETKSSKFRAFSCMTYLNRNQIHEVIGLHNSSIRSYAYIHHDKDEAEPHFHVIFRTFDAWSVASIEKWFKGYLDEKGESINTFVQRAKDLYALRDYLTHSDLDSKEQGKYQYDTKDIVDGGLFDLVPKKDAVDDTLEMLDHMVNGASTRWMVRRYGKAFVYHYSQFTAVADAIRLEAAYEENRRMNEAERLKKANLKPIPLDQESSDI